MTINTSELSKFKDFEITGDQKIIEKSQKGLEMLKEKLEKLSKIDNLTPTVECARNLNPSEIPSFNTIWSDFNFSEMKNWSSHHSIGHIGWDGLWSGQTDENGLTTVYEIEFRFRGDRDYIKDENEQIQIVKTVGKMSENLGLWWPKDIELAHKKYSATTPIDINVEGGYQVRLLYENREEQSGEIKEDIWMDLGASRDHFDLPTEPTKRIQNLHYKL
jgi:hypothetical protein